MRTRQFVCGDPEVLRRLDSFVPTAAEPGVYREVKPERREALEYRILYQAMMQTPFAPEMGRWHVQGLYVLTPSGRVLAGSNNVSEAGPILLEMDRGLERYAQMSRGERLLARAPDPARDRVSAGPEPLRPPRDGLVLRMVSRGFPCEGIGLSDTRNEFYYKLDRVWYTRPEARAFLPARLEVGAREPVPRAVFNRLVRLHLGVFVQPNLYWQGEDVKEADLSTELRDLDDEQAVVAFRGHVRMASGANGRQYEGDLLGKATYDRRSQTFVAFELLAVGAHSLGPGEKAEPGSPRTAPMGVLFTLNGKNSNDQVVPSYYSLYKWASGD